jgi:hypothetical protein
MLSVAARYSNSDCYPGPGQLDRATGLTSIRQGAGVAWITTKGPQHHNKTPPLNALLSPPQPTHTLAACVCAWELASA